mmetsp:Transcript_36377/g.67218  ORF Transcript_36377/g.67218 Transcript_36377/m.67218 type:complete len:224 (-) Transcript_36377:47-718(-)
MPERRVSRPPRGRVPSLIDPLPVLPLLLLQPTQIPFPDAQTIVVPSVHVPPQYPPGTAVHGSNVLQRLGGDLDGIASCRDDGEVQHLGIALVGLGPDLEGTLVVAVDVRSQEGELLDLDGGGAVGHDGLDGVVVLGPVPVHHDHPRLGDDPANHHVLGLPLPLTHRRSLVGRVVLDHVHPLRERNRIRVPGQNVALERHGPSCLADRVLGLRRVGHALAVDAQ